MVMETRLQVAPLRIPRIPETQAQLLLPRVKQPYEIDNACKVPNTLPGELLVEIQAVGLNPIDWKSAQYGFALPSFPCLNGREFVGRVIQLHDVPRNDIREGDLVLSVSTDYRDFRKSAYQEYAVVSSFNAVKIPKGINAPSTASIGVAFVASAIALSICLGLTFPMSNPEGCMDMLRIAQSQNQSDVPEDIVDEVFNPISPCNPPHAGDWILIYGASSVTAQITIQLAKKAGLRIVAIADLHKHERRLQALGTDKLIDRNDLAKAKDQIRAEISGPIRFALDTVGSATAQWCQDVLASRVGVQCRPLFSHSGTNDGSPAPVGSLSHLVCLTGSPEKTNSSVRVHKVPIKLFHTNEEIGREISNWLSGLLASGELALPDVIIEDGGLESIGPSLERMKRGEVSGKRLVVRLKV